MASVLGLLEAKETAARERIERRWEEADRVLVELGEAESRLDRLVIASPTAETGELLRGRCEPVAVMSGLADFRPGNTPTSSVSNFAPLPGGNVPALAVVSHARIHVMQTSRP